MFDIFRKNQNESKDLSKKIFCIGFNKTGTTSLEKALVDSGFKLGDQGIGTSLFDSWVKRDFSEICNFAKTADAFQDIPFSLPYTYIALDNFFPNAKFIHTERSSSDEWYDSIVRFHANIWGDGIKKILNADDLENAPEFHYNRLYLNRNIFDTVGQDVYNKEKLCKVYESHNYNVKRYFENRPSSFLSINLAENNSYDKMCEFLSVSKKYENFPKLNVSNDSNK